MKVTLAQLRAELARVFPDGEPTLAEHGPDGIRWHHMTAETRRVQLVVHGKSRMAARRALLVFLQGMEARKRP